MVRRTAVAACLYGALAGALVMSGSAGAWAARSEMTSQGRSSDPDPREKTSEIDGTLSKQSVVPHLALYLNFMESVGAEDDRIQKEMRQSAAQAEKRVDYGQRLVSTKMKRSWFSSFCWRPTISARICRNRKMRR